MAKSKINGVTKYVPPMVGRSRSDYLLNNHSSSHDHQKLLAFPPELLLSICNMEEHHQFNSKGLSGAIVSQ